MEEAGPSGPSLHGASSLYEDVLASPVGLFVTPAPPPQEGDSDEDEDASKDPRYSDDKLLPPSLQRGPYVYLTDASEGNADYETESESDGDSEAPRAPAKRSLPAAPAPSKRARTATYQQEVRRAPRPPPAAPVAAVPSVAPPRARAPADGAFFPPAPAGAWPDAHSAHPFSTAAYAHNWNEHGIRSPVKSLVSSYLPGIRAVGRAIEKKNKAAAAQPRARGGSQDDRANGVNRAPAGRAAAAAPSSPNSTGTSEGHNATPSAARRGGGRPVPPANSSATANLLIDLFPKQGPWAFDALPEGLRRFTVGLLGVPGVVVRRRPSHERDLHVPERRVAFGSNGKTLKLPPIQGLNLRGSDVHRLLERHQRGEAEFVARAVALQCTLDSHRPAGAHVDLSAFGNRAKSVLGLAPRFMGRSLDLPFARIIIALTTVGATFEVVRQGGGRESFKVEVPSPYYTRSQDGNLVVVPPVELHTFERLIPLERWLMHVLLPAPGVFVPPSGSFDFCLRMKRLLRLAPAGHGRFRLPGPLVCVALKLMADEGVTIKAVLPCTRIRTRIRYEVFRPAKTYVNEDGDEVKQRMLRRQLDPRELVAFLRDELDVLDAQAVDLEHYVDICNRKDLSESRREELVALYDRKLAGLVEEREEQAGLESEDDAGEGGERPSVRERSTGRDRKRAASLLFDSPEYFNEDEYGASNPAGHPWTTNDKTLLFVGGGGEAGKAYWRQFKSVSALKASATRKARCAARVEAEET
jgi:hypothetical protein